MKTTAIKMSDAQHSQLTVIAQIENKSLAEVLSQAIDTYLEAKRTDPTLADQAEAVLAELDREAASRREAVSKLLGNTSAGAKQSTRARKAADDQ